MLGPSWTTADKVELYANGNKIREERIKDGKRGGVKWSGEWMLPRFKHDTYLVAIASGPGVSELYWPISKPYQPTSTVVNRRVIGATGAVWLDADGDGKWTSPRDYADKLMRQADGKWTALVPALADADEAVAVQAAVLLRQQGVSLRDAALRAAAHKAGPQVEQGLAAYAEAWRDSQISRDQAQLREPGIRLAALLLACSERREEAGMSREEGPLLDAALVDTVADGEELLLRAQAVSHEAEERLQNLDRSRAVSRGDGAPRLDPAGASPAARPC